MSSSKLSSLIWRVTLLLAIFVGSSAFTFPTQNISPSLKVACSQQVVLSSRRVNYCKKLLHSLQVASRATGSEQMKQSKKHTQAYENNNLPLLQSIAVVVASRRLSFLVLSILLVNFVRSTILKVRMLIANCGRSLQTTSYLTL
jgi:hypothetical protein